MQQPRRDLLLNVGAVAASVVVFAVYAASAVALIRYPWDWSPDEGLALDYARRLLEAPRTLYGLTAVPFPCAWGPLQPALLAPVVAWSGNLIASARILALGWTFLGEVAVYKIVRRRAPWPLALASAALALAPVGLSFWSMLIRVDGLMMTFWLLAALPLFPREVRAGADRLPPGRIAAGTALMLCATLTKPSAAVHGAPLVLGWLLVDGPSGRRLIATLGVAGLLVLGLLQWASAGGFLWVNGLWSWHPTVPGLRLALLVHVLVRTWPAWAACLLAVLAWPARARDALRDPGWLLLLGCALIVPAMSKHGAWWNYLVPGLPALAILAGRLWGSRAPAFGGALVAASALALAATQTFPLPGPGDEQTSRTLFGFVRAYTAAHGGPILASRPDLAYFVAGQPAEIEGSSFMHLAAHGVPGTEVVIARLRQGTYTLLVQTWPFPSSADYGAAIEKSYVEAGSCEVHYFFGFRKVRLLRRRDILTGLAPAPGARCATPPGAS